MRVGDAETLDGAIKGERVSEMPVVEPEAGCGHENSPVGGVCREYEGEAQKGEEKRQGGGIHGGCLVAMGVQRVFRGCYRFISALCEN